MPLRCGGIATRLMAEATARSPKSASTGSAASLRPFSNTTDFSSTPSLTRRSAAPMSQLGSTNATVIARPPAESACPFSALRKCETWRKSGSRRDMKHVTVMLPEDSESTCLMRSENDALPETGRSSVASRRNARTEREVAQMAASKIDSLHENRPPRDLRPENLRMTTSLDVAASDATVNTT